MAEVSSQSDILAYKPNLDPNRVIKTNIVNNEYYKGPDLNINTETVLQLNSLTPSTVITAGKELLSTIEDMLNKLSLIINEKAFPEIYKSIVSNDINKANELLLDVSKDIKADNSVEIFNRLYRLKNEVNSFVSLYSKLNYGTDKTINDNDMVKTLLSYENNENNLKYINYGAINVDVKFNKLSSTFLTVSNNYAKALYDMTQTDEVSTIIDNITTVKETIGLFFNDAVKNNDNDVLKLNSIDNCGFINNTLFNVYNKRKTMLNTLSASSDIEKLNEIVDGSLMAIMQTYSEKTINDTTEAIIDYQKSITMNAMYKDNYLNSLKTKVDLRKLYGFISY